VRDFVCSRGEGLFVSEELKGVNVGVILCYVHVALLSCGCGICI
jgi:hypothetical protein